MKIIDAINRTDGLKYNTYSNGDKILWLSKLDGMVKKLIIDTHEPETAAPFSGYDEDTDPETELLVEAPYDAMYQRWLEAQIDLSNGEYDKYNASILLFNTEWDAYAGYYNRSHMPKSTGIRFRF